LTSQALSAESLEVEGFIFAPSGSWYMTREVAGSLEWAAAKGESPPHSTRPPLRAIVAL
jgi:hypothetical protein